MITVLQKSLFENEADLPELICIGCGEQRNERMPSDARQRMYECCSCHILGGPAMAVFCVTASIDWYHAPQCTLAQAIVVRVVCRTRILSMALTIWSTWFARYVPI